MLWKHRYECCHLIKSVKSWMRLTCLPECTVCHGRRMTRRPKMEIFANWFWGQLVLSAGVSSTAHQVSDIKRTVMAMGRSVKGWVCTHTHTHTYTHTHTDTHMYTNTHTHTNIHTHIHTHTHTYTHTYTHTHTPYTHTLTHTHTYSPTGWWGQGRGWTAPVWS